MAYLATNFFLGQVEFAPIIATITIIKILKLYIIIISLPSYLEKQGFL